MRSRPGDLADYAPRPRARVRAASPRTRQVTIRFFGVALLALAATLGGCNKGGAPNAAGPWVSDDKVVATVDDREALAISIARGRPEVARYLRTHPTYQATPPLWTIYHDATYPVTADEYRYRPFYCNDEYVVHLIVVSKRPPTPLPTPLPSISDLLGPTLIVNVRTQSSRILSPDDEYATPAPQPTPCLDGSKPWPYGP